MIIVLKKIIIIIIVINFKRNSFVTLKEIHYNIYFILFYFFIIVKIKLLINFF